MIPQTFPTRKRRRTSKPTPRKKVRTRERPGFILLVLYLDAVASARRSRAKRAERPSRPKCPVCRRVHLLRAPLWRSPRFRGKRDRSKDTAMSRARFRGDVANASSTRLPKRERARAARDALAAEKAVVGSIRPRRVRFFSVASVRAFRTRSSSLGAIGRVSSARGASPRAIGATTPGRSFSGTSIFFMSFFFSRLVNTRSRRNLDRGRDARSRGHPRARIGRRRVRDATEHSLSRGSRRARRASRSRRPRRHPTGA